MINIAAYEPGATSPTPGKFELGKIVATPGAIAKVPLEEMRVALSRHHQGDWGDVCKQDHQANERALHEDIRIFSVYWSKAEVKFYIVTESDRSVTTILLPEEY